MRDNIILQTRGLKKYYGKDNICWWDFYEQERYLKVNSSSEIKENS